jgi:hypothetical protein
MKQIRILQRIIFAIVLMKATIYGQSDTGVEMKRFSESLIKRFEVLPDREAFDLWQNSREPVSVSNGMINSALQNKRTEFLKLIFEAEGDCDALLSAVRTMPDSREKDEICGRCRIRERRTK